MLDNLGLEAAMDWQVQQFQQRSGIATTFQAQARGLAWDADRSLAMFRILQEALTNVMRHARAKSVDIVLKVEGGEFVLTVRDDGRGITEEEKTGRQSLGLLGMRERARLLEKMGMKTNAELTHYAIQNKLAE